MMRLNPPAAVPANAGAPAPVRRALSLAEVMISLAITSMLLTAIAAAFQSSTQVIEQNDRFFRATQSGRVALNQMTTEIRRSDSIVDKDTTVTQNGKTFTVKGISTNLLPVSRPPESRMANEMIRYYKYDPTAQRLLIYFQDPSGVLSAEYPIAENVQSSPFSWEMGKDYNNTDCVAHVAIGLDVQVGSNKIRLAGSAAPRRNLNYK
jgi:type II secretory pathway pseudopilin PulG